ncbi:ATP-dependent DNA helicase srs2 [Lithohypha guttulata]|nr:ATP-dependent DNA helicase srs2 [Lithohypha guttulata]
MEAILKGLNAAQRAAVTTQASVLQCLAPPGSGKTKTLTSRVAYLVSNGFQPQNIICCTFTIKASREMRERLRGLVGNDLEKRLILGTFHSICRRYLVTYGHLIGIPKNFGIADSNDSLGILKALQKKIRFGMDPKVARNKISHRKAKGERIEDILKTSKKSTEAQEFVTIFQEYETALAISNLLDYDDLLLRCVELLQKHPECVSNIEALLIDEFQDTNNVQYELMKLLASAKRRITIVGDPDQSIYGFRSAEVENLKRMKDYYPETVVINLEENYRSSSAILSLAQNVIEQDNERPAKKLKSTHCYGTPPVLRYLTNPHEQAAWIVSEIKRMTRMTVGLLQYTDIAILLRSTFLSLLIEKALGNAGIPYRMVGGKRFFDRAEVRLLLDYLRTINHPDNNAALLSIINTPARKVGVNTVAELTRAAENAKLSLWTLLQRVLRGEHTLDKRLSKPAEQGLNELITLIRRGQEKLQKFEPVQAPGQLIEFVASELGLRDYLKSQYREDWEERWENVKELSAQAKDVTLESLTAEDQLPEVDGVKQAQAQGAQEVLTRFLANVALSTEVESDENEIKSRVTISTIHSAKGLEWPVVFVPGVYEGSIPHSRAEDINEERRLLYVAMTRAKALLYMTFPVNQPRDAESILTQFLPHEITRSLERVGPNFSDQVIQDIATVLGRCAPSQEALAKAVTSLQDHESQYDDIWSEDGSRKVIFHTGGNGLSSLYSQHGQTFADALRSKINSHQSSNFSTYTGFTTAHEQMGLTPAQPEVAIKKEKPKLTKSFSNQGSIASFFSTGTFKDTKNNNDSLPQLARASSASVPSTTKATLPSIPKELSTHRITNEHLTNPVTALKRSRPVLADTSNIDQKPNKRAYSCFSSSPVKETFDENLPAEPAEESKYNTTMSGFKARSNTTFTSYRSGMLNTLDRPAPLHQVSTIPGVNNVSKKTLGMRRSMTGWADRKNK